MTVIKLQKRTHNTVIKHRVLYETECILLHTEVSECLLYRHSLTELLSKQPSDETTIKIYAMQKWYMQKWYMQTVTTCTDNKNEKLITEYSYRRKRNENLKRVLEIKGVSYTI